MEAVKFTSCGASSSGANARKLLEGVKPMHHYRRSVQTRAPRKRTFIAVEMMKYNPMVQTRAYETAVGGGDNGCGGNGNNLGYFRGDSGDFSGKGCQGSGLVFNPVLFAAAAAMFTVLMPAQLPKQAKAASIGASRRSAAELCLNYPTTGKGKAGKGKAVRSADVIEYGSCMLSDVEKRMVARSTQQMYCRETLRA